MGDLILRTLALAFTAATPIGEGVSVLNNMESFKEETYALPQEQAPLSQP